MLAARCEGARGDLRDDVAIHHRPDAAGAVGRGCLEHFGRRQLAHVGERSARGRIHAGSVLETLLFRLGQRLVQAGAADHGSALFDGAREQPLAQWGDQHHAGIVAAGGLAEDGHVGRVAAELFDVLLYPLEGGDNVHQRVVARSAMRRFGGEFRMRQESEQAQAILDGHHDDAVAGEALAIEGRFDSA